MIPLSDDNPTRRFPAVTVGLLVALGAVWLLVQGAGFNAQSLVASVCNLGLVPGELTKKALIGLAVPMGAGTSCVVDREPINVLTPLTSMFLHGSWGHLLGNALFLWVFGNNVEDAMGRFRFGAFYLVSGLAAAAMQVIIDPSSPVPMVGASGAISGVLGAYLVMYPHARVNMLFFFGFFLRVIPIPAWLVLLYWFGLQVLTGLPSLVSATHGVSGGVAVWAHVGGFVTGLVLVKLFENKDLVAWHKAHTLRARRSSWLDA